ncbi:MAG: vitamin B12-dependent ribonucleotide reductase [Candidatus Eisenbacteria bacterium]|nr:vitamin B12-dependent ribonucleotide reductase [Candidatus Eisenbacteria bacterium]
MAPKEFGDEGPKQILGSPAVDDQAADQARPGLAFRRHFTKPGIDPFETLSWELRTAIITNEAGEVIFEQAGVEFPRSWSMIATNVVASKYFHGAADAPDREYSLRQLITRVVDTVARWGRELGYFASSEDVEAFHDDLKHMLLHQMLSFNSPVWFNVGVEEKPQCSACFINSVEDTMASILELAKTEGMLFKWGSGSGTNFSPLRSSKEPLSGGGTASGPVSFMRGYDAFAGVIKSGGKTRRAAKMVILNVDHPDIVEYIGSKAEEEKKAWALIDAGYDGSLTGIAYNSVFFQNANHSVRVTDDFMWAVETDGPWQTRGVMTGAVIESHRARDVFRRMAEAAHTCGDPGIQFDSTINTWHTCPNSGRINASNPCSEYMFLDDTACNLASLNLMRFRTPSGDLDVDSFCHAVNTIILAQEILVDCASYPTPRITQNSYDYRPLGLGYANLGTFLMARGIPYDSDTGRHIASAITALMTGTAYRTSAEVASITGPFRGFAANREPMLAVIARHRSHVAKINPSLVPEILLRSARRVWDDALETGERWGYRNAQVTVLAPTGTIAFMMDCDTTGVEPDIALIKYKRLVGGGVLKIVNQSVAEALQYLGYGEIQAREILDYLEKHETIEGAPHLRPEDVPIFDCAFKPRTGQRFIDHMGHVKMMAAVQPFLSGAISKTVNMPRESTVDEIEQVYATAWKMGLKAIAIYRDGCKRTQPLSTSMDGEGAAPRPAARPTRHRLPDERASITHKFSIGGHEGYVTVGLYEDGKPGEIFIVMAKEGSVVSGLVDCFATAVSIALQYGVPLKVLVDKFIHSRFEPSGFTNHPEIRYAKSITDYIFRWLAHRFLPDHEVVQNGKGNGEAPHFPTTAVLPSDVGTGPAPEESRPPTEQAIFHMETDTPACPVCGSLMVRSGNCARCHNCGTSSGCAG